MPSVTKFKNHLLSTGTLTVSGPPAFCDISSAVSRSWHDSRVKESLTDSLKRALVRLRPDTARVHQLVHLVPAGTMDSCAPWDAGLRPAWSCRSMYKTSATSVSQWMAGRCWSSCARMTCASSCVMPFTAVASRQVPRPHGPQARVRYAYAAACASPGLVPKEL